VVAGLAGLALVVVGVRPGPARLSPGPVGYVNADRPGIDAHNSPAVAVHPTNPTTIVVADRIDTPRFSCSLSLSTNGGETWKQLALPLPPEAPNCHQPDVAYDADGRLFVLYTATAGRFNQPVGAWLQPFDGEAAIGPPIRVAPAEAFHARLAVAGTQVWVTWVQAAGAADRPLGFAPGPNPVMVARSSDGGATFTTAAVGDAGRRMAQPTPVVAGDRLVVGALDLGSDALDYEAQHGGQGGPPDPGPWSVLAWTSTDGGATFGPAATVAAGLVPPARIIVNLAPAPSFTYDADRHRLFAVWDAGVGDARDVFLARSDDGGTTWAPPVDVAPRPRGQFLPAVGVAADGRVDVVFYDRSRDPADVRAEVTLASSSDGGRTFRTATVSDAPFDSRIGFGGLQGIPVLGSQLAVLSQPDRALAFWSDTGRGTADTGVQDLAVASVDEKAGGGRRPVLVVAGLLLLGLGGGLLGVVARLRPRDRRPQ
jgi:hypothetical protein